MKISEFRIPKKKLDIRSIPTDNTLHSHLSKELAKEELETLLEQISEEQVVFHAARKKAILFVLQGVDSSGKDGTIKKVFATSIHPMGVTIANFKKPSSLEKSHDYLWRVHQKVPRFGHIGVFNRSHYEDVLVTVVENIISKEQGRKRLHHIREFERMLFEEGVVIRKIFLHISPQEQRERLQERLDRPEKNWKFNVADLKARSNWPAYIDAYNEVLSETDTDYAPWYVVPADKKWYRNLIVANIFKQTIASIDSQFPKLETDIRNISVPEVSWD